MARVATLEALLTLRDDMTQALAKTSSKLKSFGEDATKLGKQLSVAVTAPIMIAGTLAMNTAQQFDEVIRQVQGFAQAGGMAGDEIERLKTIAVDFGKAGIFAPKQVAQAMLDMVRDGLTPAQIAGTQLNAVYNLAASTGADMVTVQDALSGAMNAFSLTTEDAIRVSDTFAGVLFNTPATLEDLSAAMTTAAPIAGTLGIKIEDLATAIGLMAKKGITGSTAGMALRLGLINLTAPAGKAQEAMQALGLSEAEMAEAMGEVDVSAADQQQALSSLGLKVFDEKGNFIGLEQVMRQLRVSMKDLNDQQQMQALTSIFGSRAAVAWSTIVKASEPEFLKLTEAIKQQGIAQMVAGTITDSMSGKMQQFKSSIQAAQITIITALQPAITFLADLLKGLLEKFMALSPATQKWIGISLLVAAAIAPLLIIIGMLAQGLAVLPTIIGAIITALTFLAAHPIILFIMAVIAAVMLLIWVWRQWGDEITAIVNNVLAFVLAQLNLFWIFWTTLWTTIKDTAANMWLAIKDTITNTITAIVEFLMPYLMAFSDFWNTIWQSIGNFFNGIWNGIRSTVESVVNFVSSQIERLGSLVDRAVGFANKVGSFVGTAVSKITGGKIQDAIITPQGRVLTTDPRDYLIATQNPAGLMSSGIAVYITGNTIVGGNVYEVARVIGDALIDKLKQQLRIG